MHLLKTNKRKVTLFFIAIFLIYTFITLILFSHRLTGISTHYGMPDVDTDGGLWYRWYISYIQKNQLVYDLNRLEGYPFGFDMSGPPVDNLIYNLHVFLITLGGFSWQKLIFVTNIFSLITYPLSAFTAALLCYYLTKNRIASFISGLIYGFSFYHVFMGRGQMSINHIELVPLYFLSLFYYLDKKTWFALLLSVLTFSIVFMADPYYAFFSGLFSGVIVLFYKQEPLKEKVITLVKYYGSLGVVLVLTNLNFVISNLYLFDTAQRIQSKRVFYPRNELANIMYYFSPLQLNSIYSFPVLGKALYAVTILLSSLGAVLFRKNRLYIIFLFCAFMGIILSAYVPNLFWINELYFKFFGMFRGVGRITMLTYLFIGLMVGIGISEISKSGHLTHVSKPIRFILVGALALIIIMSSIPSDPTWYRKTDFSKIAALYEPIRSNPSIHAIAAYPMELNFGNTGFPQTYELMGQIVHEKPYAKGVDQYSSVAPEYREKIKDLSKKDTVSNLAKYGVDTILIYNRMLKRPDIVEQLQKDSRLTFLGRFTQPYDDYYISASDLSRDISVFHIKPQYVTEIPKLFFTTTATPLSYKKINDHMFLVQLQDQKSRDQLVFSSPYSAKWQLVKGDLTNKNDFYFLSNAFPQEEKNIPYNEYYNSWMVQQEESEDPVTMTVYFKPYYLSHIEGIISRATILAIVFILGFSLWNRSSLQKKASTFFKKKFV